MDRLRYLVGIVTLALAVAGGVYLVSLLGDEDQSGYFRLEIEFASTEGLLPGADVKYRGVQVGSVRRVKLRDDGEKGIAVVALSPGQAHLARTNTRFWIVTPRFGGLASGATGLETLVRDAYVSFLNPEDHGEPLANGSTVTGWEKPFLEAPTAARPPPRRGDLLLTLLVPENHGLVPGSRVVFRGIPTGEVREVALAKDGSHVRVQLLIDRRHRPTVTEKTVFWVARPRLSGGLVGGLSLEDVSAILSPFVSYYTEPGQGLPVSDGYVVAADVQRPDIALHKVSAERHADSSAGVEPPPAEKAVELVQVLYEAEEEDWFSADDRIARDGTGLLYEDRDGQRLVVTARSLCDAGYFERDTFGAQPDVASEGIRVVLVDGTTYRAHRIWAAEGDRDLALLALDLGANPLDAPAGTPEELFWFDTPAAPPGVLACRALDAERHAVDTELAEGAPLPSLEGRRGAAVLRDGRVVGLLGQVSGTDDAPRIEPIAGLPESLRPRR